MAIPSSSSPSQADQAANPGTGSSELAIHQVDFGGEGVEIGTGDGGVDARLRDLLVGPQRLIEVIDQNGEDAVDRPVGKERLGEIERFRVGALPVSGNRGRVDGVEILEMGFDQLHHLIELLRSRCGNGTQIAGVEDRRQLVGIGPLFRQILLRPGGQPGARIVLRQRARHRRSAGSDRQPGQHHQQHEPGKQHSSYHFL